MRKIRIKNILIITKYNKLGPIDEKAFIHNSVLNVKLTLNHLQFSSHLIFFFFCN